MCSFFTAYANSSSRFHSFPKLAESVMNQKRAHASRISAARAALLCRLRLARLKIPLMIIIVNYSRASLCDINLQRSGNNPSKIQTPGYNSVHYTCEQNTQNSFAHGVPPPLRFPEVFPKCIKYPIFL